MIGGPQSPTTGWAMAQKGLQSLHFGGARSRGRTCHSRYLHESIYSGYRYHLPPTLAYFAILEKKEPELQPVHHALLAILHPEQIEVEFWRADELEMRRGLSSELDEMWSFVQAKAHPRWLWHAIDHHTGKVLAYVFGRRKDTVFLKLKALLEPFGITRYYTDGWGAYERHLDAENHRVGKENTQKIESKHINLRTRIKRLVRRTICFSKTEQMHDLVIGLFINRHEFGRAI